MLLMHMDGVVLQHSRLLLCSARPDGYHMYIEPVIIEGDGARWNAGSRVVMCRDVLKSPSFLEYLL